MYITRLTSNEIFSPSKKEYIGKWVGLRTYQHPYIKYDSLEMEYIFLVLFKYVHKFVQRITSLIILVAQLLVP